MDRIARRNIVNNVMLTLTGICTVLTSSVLFLILGFLVCQWLAITELELLHQAAACPRAKPAEAWPMPSWAAAY